MSSGNTGNSRSTQIMITVREMGASGASQQEIAQRAGTSQGHVTQASRLLDNAPDLAGQVERGEIGITTAYRALLQRRLARLSAELNS
jgi:hypothetical protein